jgi:uncharacterized protein with ParB-like and HNH nuclease domain
MLEYQERVHEERDELNSKLFSLNKFMIDYSFSNNLVIEEYSRLRRQVHAMSKYLEVLDERIEAFKGED